MKMQERTDLHVRLSPSLMAQLRAAASENGRTLNAEISQRLKASFEERWR
jgi:hypothetical protein